MLARGSCLITNPHDSGADGLLASWLRRFNGSSARVVSTTPLATVVRGRRTIALFVDAIIESERGDRMPRCMLLRGDAAIVIALLRVNDTGELYSLMVEQLRPVDGTNTFEFVGGMIEADETPRQCAVREVSEELGIAIEENDLISLFPEPIQVCTAMLDERAYFFAFEKTVDSQFVKSLEGTSQGEHSDGEHIRVKVVDFEFVERQPVFSAQVGAFLIRQLFGSPNRRKSKPPSISELSQ